jgi:Mrp family chromosome partitioning ATPase
MRTPPTRVARKSPATWKRFARVVEAEKSVEDYKVANGLAGASDTSLVQQQLKDLNDQIVAARQRMSDAHARSDQIEVARRKGGDVGSDAAQLDLTSLGPLRAQQAEAHKKFVEAAELGPRHPQVIDAQARLRAADAAVVAEFARLAQIQRTDYAGAKALEASLTRQVDDLERQTNANDPSMIGLRDLERKASAARDAYELFVNRSRDTGETKQIEPTGAKIISTAAPPSTRTFPPNSYLLAELGFLLGLGLGYLSALRRGGRGPAPDAPPIGADDDRSPVERAQPPEPDPSPRDAAPPFDAAAAPSEATVAPRLTVGASTPLRTRTRRQSLDRLDLIDLGFPALRDSADATEFEAVLKAVDFAYPRSRDLPRAGPRRRFVLVVAGSNEFGDRTALAINLALTAARGGARVVLLDAAGRNAKLTRAVRVASRKPILDAGTVYETENDVRLALPKALDAERGRQRPEAMLRNFLDSRDEALDLIVCDGPGASEVEAASVFEYANAIVALDGAEEAATLEQLAGLGFAPGVLVRFEMHEDATRKIA